MNIIHKITNLDNIKNAYLDLISILSEKNKIHSYAGIDSLHLSDININSIDVLKQIQNEMLNYEKILAAKCIYIPKSNGELRDIYIYSIKDRIKAQAVYRILEPIFERHYSSYLFSYRPNYSSYLAIRSVVRRYKKNYQKDYLGLIDISNYSYDIDHEILLKKIKKLNLDPSTMKLLKLFIKTEILKDGKLYTPTTGPITGLPLAALFCNIYLNDIDKYIGKRVSLYKRVGDDLIMLDKNKDKLWSIFQTAKEEISKLQLNIKEQKSQFISANQKFTFLGYTFKGGIISLPSSYCKKFIQKMSSSILNNQLKNEVVKIKRLNQLFYNKEIININQQMQNLALQKKFVNDYDQLKKLDYEMVKITCRYFFKRYNPKNARLLKNILKKNKLVIPSFFKFIIKQQHAKTKVTN
jgi:hypothetical protein